MGHRFSKTAANNIAISAEGEAGRPQTRQVSKNNKNTTPATTSCYNAPPQAPTTTSTKSTGSKRIPIPSNKSKNNNLGPTINLQIQESPAAGANATYCPLPTTVGHNILTATQPSALIGSAGLALGAGSLSSHSSSLASVNNLSCSRQIIIKIQLAKMENGNEMQQQQQCHTTADSSLENVAADCNLNSSDLLTMATAASNSASGANATAQILNVTLNSGSSSAAACTTSSSSSSSGRNSLTNLNRTTGSSISTSSPAPTTTILAVNNNYLNPSKNNSTNYTVTAVTATPSSTPATCTSNMDAPCTTMSLSERLGRLNTLQFNDEIVEQNIGEIVEYCEVLEDQSQQQVPPPVPPSSSTSAKRRFRKCSCRDAFRRLLNPSQSRSSNSRACNAAERHSINNPLSIGSRSTALKPLTTAATTTAATANMSQRNSIHSTVMMPSAPTGATAAAMMASAAAAAAAAAAASSTAASTSAAAASASNQLAVWAPVTTTNGSDVLIPLATPSQFVVVQCNIVNPPHLSTSAANSSPLTAPSTILQLETSSSNVMTNNSSSSPSPPHSNDIMSKRSAAAATSSGPIVHSHVDFVHYLVPDLEKITNASYYWGKMDRYEAESLLEGKPEGTYLLRDSAQEEFLFSVTFRKYGRSLHARIEQSGHQFSFDCHDPCVFTASTVTGLLEHYKDPTCVMFFEPMLTIPLHRKNCFSLQQLCRATIVTRTTYDGINELELPSRLKAYLKEYHYKQKLRVIKNEPTYTMHCK